MEGRGGAMHGPLKFVDGVLDGEKSLTVEMRPSRLLQAGAKLAEFMLVGQVKTMMRKSLKHTPAMENWETIYFGKEILNT